MQQDKIDQLRFQLDAIHADLTDQYNTLSKRLDSLVPFNMQIITDLNAAKKAVKDTDEKVDAILEILNNFTIMLQSDESDIEEEYEDQWLNNEDEDEWGTF